MPRPLDNISIVFKETLLTNALPYKFRSDKMHQDALYAHKQKASFFKTIFSYVYCAVFVSACSGDKETDVLFAYDASSLGFRKSEVIGRFVYTLVSSLDLSTGKVNVGRITDNCPRYSNVPLGRDTKLFTDLQFPGIGQLLQSMNQSFPTRLNVKRVGVLVVDESTTGERDAIDFIKKNPSFDLMVIAIGDPYTTGFAADLASDPDFNYLVRVPKYSDLSTAFSQVLDKLCTIIKRSFVIGLKH